MVVDTHLAIWMKPQEAAACRGVQPSLSPLLTSLPFSTRNCTISAFSSMQACQRTNVRMMRMIAVYNCLLFILTLTNGCQSEYSFSTVEEVSDPLHHGSLLKAKLQTLPKSVKLNQSSEAKTMTTVSPCCNDFLLSGLLKALKYFSKQSFCSTSETAILFSSFSSS